MPMRRISTGLPRYGFADDASPLSEGLANAAATLGELWPRLNQIEADKQREATVFADREAERAAAREERTAANNERRQLWEATQGVYRGNDPALSTASGNAAAKIKADLTPKADKPRDWDSAWKQAIDELGDPDGDNEVIQVIDANGNKRPQVIKRPLSPEERQGRVNRLNSRALELTGHPFRPIALPPETEPLPDAAPVDAPAVPQGQPLWQPTAEQPATPAEPQPVAPKLWDIAPKPAATAATPTPSVGSGQEQARRQFMAGAGGFGLFPGANLTGAMPSASSAPAQPQQAQQPPQPTGPDPDPQYVQGLAQMVSTDPQRLKGLLLDLKSRDPAAYQVTAQRLRELASAQP
jgi:hypothetical protein